MTGQFFDNLSRQLDKGRGQTTLEGYQVQAKVKILNSKVDCCQPMRSQHSVVSKASNNIQCSTTTTFDHHNHIWKPPHSAERHQPQQTLIPSSSKPDKLPQQQQTHSSQPPQHPQIPTQPHNLWTLPLNLLLHQRKEIMRQSRMMMQTVSEIIVN